MAVTTEKLEASLELALVALGQVCQTGTNDEKIAASRELVQAVEMAGTQLRKAMLAERVYPLIETVTKNLAGQLADDDEFCPVYSLGVAEQSALLLGVTKEIR
jgi:hypothetical protein